MGNEELIELALGMLSCSQKELAVRLGVSPTQISKWKKGEYMSSEMEKKIREILNIGDRDPKFIMWAGSLKEADKWEKLIRFLAEMAVENAGTGYNTYPLQDEEDLLCWQTFYVMKEIGIEIPKSFPEELEVEGDYWDVGEDDDEKDIEMWGILENNPYSALIQNIYKSLNDVYGFYAAYIEDLMNDDDLELYGTAACNIEPCLMELAACKVEVDEKLAPRFREFKHKLQQDYERWINIVKDKAFRAGIPLRAELLDLVFGTHDALGHEAEAESLGFNSSRLHPDVYMNELLCGMRAIHQVLPAIMKKLGIEDEFKLDESEFWVK